MCKSGEVAASHEELRGTSWARELPKLISGKKMLKLAISQEHKPFIYAVITLKTELPGSAISKSIEYDSTYTARKKIIHSKRQSAIKLAIMADELYERDEEMF